MNYRLGYVDNTDLVKDEYYDEDGIHFVSEFYQYGQVHGGGVFIMTNRGSVTRTRTF